MRSLLLLLLVIPGTSCGQGEAPPSGFVRVDEVIPTVVLDMRYAGSHNFIGKPIEGYRAPVAYLTREAAFALSRVQEELMSLGLSIKIYDAYRPQRAVDHFIEWARDVDDRAVKAEFYPTVSKDSLFEQGYIAARSGHSRGSTLDLTIVAYPPAEQQEWSIDMQKACTLPAEERYRDNSLDMGTGYDCFDTLSWTADDRIGSTQRAHRLLLKTLMEKYGFENYPREWWHFTLENEPFPDTYFDFPVQ